MSSPASESPRPAKPQGRARLAAALGGAGVLAVGLGAGVLQSAAQDAGPQAAPGEEALGAQQPQTAAAAAQPAASAQATQTETSTAPATVTGTQDAPPPAAPATPAPDPAPAPEPASTPSNASPDQPAVPAPSEAAAAAPDATAVASPAAATADPASPGTAAGQDKGRDAAAKKDAAAAEEAPAEDCDDVDAKAAASDEAITLQGHDHDHGDEAAGVCVVEEETTTSKTTKKRKKAKKRVDHGEAGDPSVDRRPAPAPIRNAGGVPTLANPSTSIAMPGPAPIGVPNFFIDKFRIPPFLLPIYQAAGTEYGVRWEVLAAINEIETDYGRNVNVSSAGALGWMQFMPATWKAYGVDANGDGRKDPYNPVDAIFAAARYLKAAGADKDLYKAIFAYNHADWYVDSVLMRARLVGGLPVDLVGSLTGLTQGRFPIGAKARYAADLDEQRSPKAKAAVKVVESDSTRRGIMIFANEGAPAVATHDGKVVGRGTDKRLGRYVQVRDTHGNTYTYARLQKLEATHPVPKRGAKPKLVEPISVDDEVAVEPKPGAPVVEAENGAKERLFAHPARPKAFKAGGSEQVGVPAPKVKGNDEYVKDLLHLRPDQVTWKELEKGSTVVAGTVIGTVGKTSSTRSPHMLFEIRPAGRGAPRIDPKPILDGWKLLESTAIYRAHTKNPFFGKDSKAPTIGQILLMSKETLQRRVLANPDVKIHESGRQDISKGMIDRRVLALL
ncbi:MAG: GH23 / GH103 [uncultured Solirubrobacteraceae bacterium]|uniref:GH23 / GH103 n=1 Tax=uncultured Solirubrobacteraceae bacterium TaxID=1162706 RepID=A0A6J4ST52_9ACTN|nr:MAG: GH23 / GH103 [uncultured Solirubrobacteraceae bacterium]